jgi:two-component system alkaline phosphatase synthesis response regulator PhoP
MIWCVDDDNTIRDIEVYTLTQTGFEAKGFADGISMLEALKTEKPELIVLDIMLPGKDGVEILKEIRSNPETRKIPVIMATAKGTEMDKIQGLDTGADDYLVKPFGVMEMVSRIKAVLRRCEPDEKEEVLSIGEITLSDKEHLVTVNGEKVVLTFKEFEILKLFMSNPGIVFSRDKLLSKV